MYVSFDIAIVHGIQNICCVLNLTKYEMALEITADFP